jgi:hypothetical protein
VTATAAAIATATPTPTLALAVVPAQLLPGGFGALFVFEFASAVVALFVSVAVVLLTGDDDDAEPTDDDEEDERVATTLDVVVEDAVIGEPFARPVTFVAEPTGADEQGRGGTGRNEPVVVDSPTGEATIELPLGEWELTASDDAGEIDAATVGTLDSELYLTASPWQINLTLRGGDERGPLVPDAAVRAAPDLGDPVTARSDPTGRVTLRVPRSADETTLVVDADGDARYHHDGRRPSDPDDGVARAGLDDPSRRCTSRPDRRGRHRDRRRSSGRGVPPPCRRGCRQ